MIVTSTALMRSRTKNVELIVKDLLSGEVVPDKILFFISEEPHHLDEGIKPSEIPNVIDPKVELIYTPNIGSLRKIIPVLKMYWSRPHTQIVIVDDDFRVPKDYLKNLLDFQEDINNRFKACGYAGNFYLDEKIKAKTPEEKKTGRSIQLGWTFKEPKQVDLINSGMGLLVKPKFFPEEIFKWYKHPELGLNYTDEHYINYMLAVKGIPRVLVPISSCPEAMETPFRNCDHYDVAKYKYRQSRKFKSKMVEWRK